MPEVPPAKLELVRRRIPQRRFARTAGFSDHYVNQCLNGYIKPSRRFRASLAAFLDLPESELFPDDRQAVVS